MKNLEDHYETQNEPKHIFTHFKFKKIICIPNTFISVIIFKIKDAITLLVIIIMRFA